ncbi:MAG: hypothetical protein ACC657_05305 [Thiohalomonadales bacterium]
MSGGIHTCGQILPGGHGLHSGGSGGFVGGKHLGTYLSGRAGLTCNRIRSKRILNRS